MKQGRHPLVVGLLGAIGAMFDRQVNALAIRQQLLPVAPSEVNYFGVPDSRRHNRGGTAAAKRAARKRRNVIRNRRAHRG